MPVLRTVSGIAMLYYTLNDDEAGELLRLLFTSSFQGSLLSKNRKSVYDIRSLKFSNISAFVSPIVCFLI